MKARLQRCLEIYPIPDWSATILQRNQNIKGVMSELPFWTKSVCEWNPTECESANFHIAYRSVGRPLTRWRGFNSED